MLHQHEYEKACLEAGKNSHEYTTKIDALKARWNPKKDSTEARIMRPILSLHTSPLQYSVIADNLEYFKLHYKEEKLEPESALQIACLCGSRNITDFLLQEMNLNYLSPDHEYLLPYISASQNTEWMKDIATKMAQEGKSMPQDIIRLAAGKVFNMIRDIFRQVEQTQNNCIINKTPSLSSNVSTTKK